MRVQRFAIWVLMWLSLLGVQPARVAGQRPERVRAGQSIDHGPAIARARQIADSLFRSQGLPGLSVAVGIGGQVVWTEGFGFADVENRVPVTPLTRMRIGSVSKSVTSSALAQLYEEGRLDLDAEVQQYVPTFPRKRWPVTVREVAGHIAGIRHYRDDENESAVRYPTVLSGLAIFEDDSLLFEPGTRYSYSSYGWNLLSAVVEGASGQPFLTYMREHVFEPLGLRSMIAEHTDSIIDWRSTFYERTRDGVLLRAPYVDNSYKWAGGGFISNTEDMVRYGMDWLDASFLKPETVVLFFTSQTLGNGDETGYGMGWFTRTDELGRKLVWHTGGSVGGRAVLALIPGEDIVVAMLANAGWAPMSLANALKVAAPFRAER